MPRDVFFVSFIASFPGEKETSKKRGPWPDATHFSFTAPVTGPTRRITVSPNVVNLLQSLRIIQAVFAVSEILRTSQMT